MIAASMPSGVEHIVPSACLRGGLRVIAASMPSGVEHQKVNIVRLKPKKSDRRIDAFGR